MCKKKGDGTQLQITELYIKYLSLLRRIFSRGNGKIFPIKIRWIQYSLLLEWRGWERCGGGHWSEFSVQTESCQKKISESGSSCVVECHSFRLHGSPICLPFNEAYHYLSFPFTPISACTGPTHISLKIKNLEDGGR